MRKLIASFLALFIIASPYTNADNRIITVAKSGGDFTNPVTAMNSIKDASSNKRYKIQIGPGKFNLGTKQLRIKPYVSVEGAGIEMTELFGVVVGKYKGLIRIEHDSELSHLKVNNKPQFSTSTQHTGIYIGNYPGSNSNTLFREPQLAIRHIIVNAGGASTGIISLLNAVLLDNVLAAGGTAYQGYKSFVEMKNVRLFSFDPLLGDSTDRYSFGGTNLKLIRSVADLDDVVFGAHGLDFGPRHIIASDRSTISIKNSEFETVFDTNLITIDSTSMIKMSNSSIENARSYLLANSKVSCINSFDPVAFIHLNSQCLPQ